MIKRSLRSTPRFTMSIVTIALKTAFLLLTLSSVALGAVGNQDPDDLEKIRGEFEAAANRYTHFATDDFVKNREIRLDNWYKKLQKLAQQQTDLAKDLERWGKQPELVRKLNKHPDPKVRTLVIATLYARLDPTDLVYIASVRKDNAPTFKYLHHPRSAGGYTGDLTEIEDPQTVGDVAGKMLLEYFEAAGEGGDMEIEQCDFNKYWSVRANRKTCASWFLVQVKYATRSTSPLQPQYRNDVAAAIAKIKALPLNERAWTQLFIRTRGFTDIEDYLSEADCLAALKEVGPDQIMKFLKCESVVDDPDLNFEAGKEYRHRVHFFMVAVRIKKREGTAESRRCSGFARARNVSARTPNFNWCFISMGRVRSRISGSRGHRERRRDH